MTDEQFVKHLNVFFKYIAPSCSYEEYKLTFALFIFLDHFKDKLENNGYPVYLSEILDGYLDPGSHIFENIYPPTGLTEEQVMQGIKLVNKRNLFRVNCSEKEKLLRVTFLGE
jgi:hypothetical protein